MLRTENDTHSCNPALFFTFEEGPVSAVILMPDLNFASSLFRI